jgi:hypothetical protein
MICQPSWVTPDIVGPATRQAAEKKSGAAPERVRFAPYTGGRRVQILHTGSDDPEGPALARLHAEYLPQDGLTVDGRHHGIHRSDARRTDPAKLRTILRRARRSLLSPDQHPVGVSPAGRRATGW